MTNLNYICPKCKNNQCEIGEMRATGGALSKLFDVQNKKIYLGNLYTL